MSIEFLRAIWRMLIAILCCLLLYVFGWLTIDVRNYIEVHSITVPNVKTGTLPSIAIDRDLYREFSGGYRVTIKNLVENNTVCSSGFVAHTYESSGPIVGKDLGWWSSGGGCKESLLLRQNAGLYSVKSCHYVKPYWFYPKKELCWQPAAVFEWLE